VIGTKDSRYHFNNNSGVVRRCNRKNVNESQCPARGKKCGKCAKIGHFAAVCRTKTVQRKAVGEISKTSDELVREWDETFFLCSVMLCNRDKDPWQVDLKVLMSQKIFLIFGRGQKVG
jgi:hypothetical protein